jgi:hypothetical protein
MTAVTYPSGPICPHGAYDFIRTRHPQVSYHRSQDPTDPTDKAFNFHLSGGRAPHRFVHDAGIRLAPKSKGWMAPWQIQQQQGATQDGATFNGAVYDPVELTLPLVAFGKTPQLRRQVIRDWIEAWDVKRQGELSVVVDNKFLYAPARWAKVPVDPIRLGGSHLIERMTWDIQIDDAFWRGIDSISVFQGNGTGFQTVTNFGDQDEYIDHTFYGPGTVQIANGPGSSSMITFGPLLPNQIARLRTSPTFRNVYDLTPAGANVPQQQLTAWQKFIKALVSFATNNNPGSLLRWFESLFGVLPPQGELYTLLNGRFTKPVPAKPLASPPVESNIAVKITGGDSNTKLITELTPRYRWPF